MPDPILDFKNLTPPALATPCGTGQHLVHPGETCAELDARQVELRARLDEFIHAAFDLADERWITGCGTGETRGFLSHEEHEPTPVDRALELLAPHLADVALYRPRVRAMGILPAARRR